MADYRYDRTRGREAGQGYGSYTQNENGYGRGRKAGGRNRALGVRERDDERGFFDRAGDEVRSWFGDEEAERRRQRDERGEDRQRTLGGYGRDDDDRGRRWSRSRDDDTAQGGLIGGGYTGSERWAQDNDRSRDQDRDRGVGRGGSGGSPFGNEARGREPSGRQGFGGRASGSQEGGNRMQGRSDIDRDREQARQGSGGSHPFDESYRTWRDQQMQQFDRDYEDYRRHRQSSFDSEFEGWRKNRPQQAQGGQTQDRAARNSAAEDSGQLGSGIGQTTTGQGSSFGTAGGYGGSASSTSSWSPSNPAGAGDQAPAGAVGGSTDAATASPLGQDAGASSGKADEKKK